jgi:hypothetical protein
VGGDMYKDFPFFSIVVNNQEVPRGEDW